MAVIKGFKEGVTERWREHRVMFIITVVIVAVFLVLLSGLIVQVDVQVTR